MKYRIKINKEITTRLIRLRLLPLQSIFEDITIFHLEYYASRSIHLHVANRWFFLASLRTVNHARKAVINYLLRRINDLKCILDNNEILNNSDRAISNDDI